MLKSQKEQMVTDWNKKYIPGQKVKVLLDSGTEKVTTTRSNAELLSGHTPVIWLYGITGCYCLDRVTAVH